MKKQIFSFLMFLVFLVLVALLIQQILHNEPEQQDLQHHIITDPAYKLTQDQEIISIVFPFSKSWIPEMINEKNYLNKELHQRSNTIVLLEYISNESDYIYLSILLDTHLKKGDAGEFISNYIVDPLNRTQTYTPVRVFFSDSGKNVQIPYGSTKGPGSRVGIKIGKVVLDELGMEFSIKISGLNLIIYSKMQ